MYGFFLNNMYLFIFVLVDALQEEKIMLIKILQKFRVESVKDKVPSHMQIVLNPVGGVPLRIFHRDQEQ